MLTGHRAIAITIMLSDIRTLCETQFGDNALGLSDTHWTQFIGNAVREYNVHRPQQTTATFTGDTTNVYDLPTAWDTTFSTMIAVRYQFENQTFLVLDDMQYTLTADSLVFVENLATTDTIEVAFTIQHVVSNTEHTVPDHDADALVDYACYRACLHLSGEHVPDIDNTFNGATLTQRPRKSKSEEYRDLAQTYLNSWRQRLGISKDGTKPQTLGFSRVPISLPSKGLFH